MHHAKKDGGDGEAICKIETRVGSARRRGDDALEKAGGEQRNRSNGGQVSSAGVSVRILMEYAEGPAQT